MGKCVLLALIATSLFLLSNCSKVQQAPEAKVEKMVYSNNFSTLEIRSFWHMCSLTFRQKNPFTQPEFLVEHCDCYSDYIRKTYKNKLELDTLAVSDNLSKKLITECNFKLQQEKALADPA